MSQASRRLSLLLVAVLAALWLAVWQAVIGTWQFRDQR